MRDSFKTASLSQFTQALPLLIVGCISLFTGTSLAQGDQADYLELYTGERIEVEKITTKGSLLKMTHLLADGKHYDVNTVAYYQSFGVLHANIRELSAIKYSRFIPRIEAGKANLFEYSRIQSAGFGFYGVSFTQSKPVYYYNLDGGPLQKARIRNLKKDIGQDLNCMKLLKQHSSSNGTEFLLYTVAILATSVGIIASFSGEEPAIFPISLGVTAVSILVAGHLDRNVQPKKLRQSIIVYNQNQRYEEF